MSRRIRHTQSAGVTRDVAFESVYGSINDRIDDAYRTKYKGSPYLAAMICTRARSATIKAVDSDLKV